MTVVVVLWSIHLRFEYYVHLKTTVLNTEQLTVSVESTLGCQQLEFLDSARNAEYPFRLFDQHFSEAGDTICRSGI
jgi:hypothetical protein